MAPCPTGSSPRTPPACTTTPRGRRPAEPGTTGSSGVQSEPPRTRRRPGSTTRASVLAREDPRHHRQADEAGEGDRLPPAPAGDVGRSISSVKQVMKTKPSALVIQSRSRRGGMPGPALVESPQSVTRAADATIMNAGSNNVDHHIEPDPQPAHLVLARDGRKKTLWNRCATWRLPRTTEGAASRARPRTRALRPGAGRAVEYHLRPSSWVRNVVRCPRQGTTCRSVRRAPRGSPGVKLRTTRQAALCTEDVLRSPAGGLRTTYSKPMER